MKQKLICAILASTLAFAFAAHGDTTWSGNVTLDDNFSETAKLTIETGAVIDLNGHDLSMVVPTWGSFVVNGACTIKNSDTTGSAKTVHLEITDAYGFWNQFQRITFEGNLKLEVKGRVRTATQDGFKGMHNTHTGGTVLTNFYPEDGGLADAKYGRISTSDGLGVGDVVLADGTMLRQISSETITIDGNSRNGIYPRWPTLSSTGENVTNLFLNEYTFAYTGAIYVDVNNTLKFDGNGTGNARLFFKDGSQSADFTNVKGTLWIANENNNNPDIESDMPDGTLMLSGNAKIDHTGSGTWRLGALASPEDVTAATDQAQIMHSDTETDLTVEIGSANRDTTFYGRITGDTTSFKKVGTGTLTLGGINAYKGQTEFAEGAVRTLASTELLHSQADASSKFTFSGGELIFGEAPGNLLANTPYRYVATTAPVRIGVEEGVDAIMNYSLEDGVTAGLVKTGEGTLDLTKGAARYTGKTIVSNGTLKVKFFTQGSLPSNVTFEKESGANLELSLHNESGRFGNDTLTGLPDGTIVNISGKGNNCLPRFTQVTGFKGTINIVGDTDVATGASGFVGSNPAVAGSSDIAWGVLGNPDSLRMLFTMEQANNATAKLGAFNLPYANAAICIKTSMTLEIGALNQTSVINGCLTAKTGNTTTVKHIGTGALVIGSDFSTKQISSDGKSFEDAVANVAFDIQSGTFINNADLTASNYSFTFPSESGKVMLAGTGTFKNVNLSVTDIEVPASSTFVDKNKSYSLLTAQSIEGTSANIDALLIELNKNDKHGKWVETRVPNGDGTVTLECGYRKNGLTIILR